MSINIKIFLLLIICLAGLGCNSNHQIEETETTVADSGLSSLVWSTIPNIIGTCETYYETHQQYPATKEDFLQFYQSHDKYKNINSDLITNMKYELLEEDHLQIGIPIENQTDGTTQYLDIKLGKKNPMFDYLSPETQELIRKQIQNGLQDLFQKQNAVNCSEEI